MGLHHSNLSVPSSAVGSRRDSRRASTTDAYEAHPRGVCLAVLRQLRAEAEALQASEGLPRTGRLGEGDSSCRGAGTRLTTEDVCFELIRPRTAETRGAYIESIPSELVGRASLYVSHAWQSAFADLVDSIEAAYGEGDNPFIWLDLVMHPQWDTAERPFAWWTSTFQETIRSIGTVLLVLAPFGDPFVLTRCWCLFEVHAAVQSGARLRVGMPPAEVDAFQLALVSDIDSLSAHLSTVSLERAQTRSAADRTNILDAVRATTNGIHAFDLRVLSVLRKWLAQCGRQALAADPANHTLALQLARLLVEQGDIEEAEKLLLQTREALGDAFDSSEPRTLSALSRLGVVLASCGQPELAEPLLLQVADRYERELGANHLRTLASMGELGIAVGKLGRRQEAESLLRHALIGTYRQEGLLDLATLRWASALASVIAEDGSRLEDAAKLFEGALTGYEHTLGGRAPSTLDALYSLALVREQQGQLREAEEHYRRALVGFESALGHSHPSVTKCKAALANGKLRLQRVSTVRERSSSVSIASRLLV